ncbi:MAG: hypothetical protein ACE5LF_06190 [Alphaproteobacteria bacterium]
MTTGTKEGRRRLGLLLSGVSGGLCVLAMGAALVFLGTPWNPMWWWVMAAVLVAALVLPRALVPAVEWVIDGYRDGKKG